MRSACAAEALWHGDRHPGRLGCQEAAKQCVASHTTRNKGHMLADIRSGVRLRIMRQEGR